MFYVQREDNSFYETHNIDDVLLDDNSAGKAIRVVSVELNKISSAGADQKKVVEDKENSLAYIGFSSKRKDYNIVFFITAEDRDWSYLLADELDTQIKRTLKKKPWTIVDPKTIDAVLFLSIFFLAMHFLPRVFTHSPSIQLSNQQISTMGQADAARAALMVLMDKHNNSDSGYMLFVVIIIGIIVAADKLPTPSSIIHKCNRPVFSWGDAAAAHERFERRINQIKWVVIIGFAVSLLATLVGAIILKY